MSNAIKNPKSIEELRQVCDKNPVNSIIAPPFRDEIILDFSGEEEYLSFLDTAIEIIQSQIDAIKMLTERKDIPLDMPLPKLNIDKFYMPDVGHVKINKLYRY